MIKIDYAFWRAPFEEVAAEVHILANRAGVNFRDLLQEAGVSISTWKRWKNGSVAASFDKFGAIIKVLEIHVKQPKGPAHGSKAKKQR
tara:strand:+ start:969 stop:1232 length:264 start_codon:yes stop_codon:yes gene_type:complete